MYSATVSSLRKNVARIAATILLFGTSLISLFVGSFFMAKDVEKLRLMPWRNITLFRSHVGVILEYVILPLTTRLYLATFHI